MPFPLRIGDRVVASPPELASLALADAAGPGGTLVPGQRPARWVADLVATGALEAKLAIGLGAALIQHPNPVAVAEGARLAVALHPSPLGDMVVLALDAHDAGLLLQVDPAGDGASVEDSLLRSAVKVARLSEPFLRDRVLTRLRHAGLPDLELQVLAEHGSLSELQTWIPALLEEPLGDEGIDRLRARVGRGDEGGRWLAEALEG